MQKYITKSKQNRKAYCLFYDIDKNHRRSNYVSYRRVIAEGVSAINLDVHLYVSAIWRLLLILPTTLLELVVTNCGCVLCNTNKLERHGIADNAFDDDRD